MNSNKGLLQVSIAVPHDIAYTLQVSSAHILSKFCQSNVTKDEKGRHGWACGNINNPIQVSLGICKQYFLLLSDTAQATLCPISSPCKELPCLLPMPAEQLRCMHQSHIRQKHSSQVHFMCHAIACFSLLSVTVTSVGETRYF